MSAVFPPLLLCFVAVAFAATRGDVATVVGPLDTVVVSGRTPDLPSFVELKPAWWQVPVDSPLQISSPFGPRWKWSTSADDFHRGIDYYGETNDNIYAIANGTVFQVHTVAGGTMPGGGNVLIIEHALTTPAPFHTRNVSKVYSYYFHMNSFESVAVVGTFVRRGERLGGMGQTGETTFTHLHLETRLQGYCSLQYQAANDRAASPTSSCNTGFDPHVHPFLFIGGSIGTGTMSIDEVTPTSGHAWAARVCVNRNRLCLDVIETDLGRVGFNLRTGMNAITLATLDNLSNINAWLSLVPHEFLSTSTTDACYEMHFPQVPQYVETLDLYGNGLRYESAYNLSAFSSVAASSLMSGAQEVSFVGAIVTTTLAVMMGSIL